MKTNIDTKIFESLFEENLKHVNRLMPWMQRRHQIAIEPKSTKASPPIWKYELCPGKYETFKASFVAANLSLSAWFDSQRMWQPKLDISDLWLTVERLNYSGLRLAVYRKSV